MTDCTNCSHGAYYDTWDGNRTCLVCGHVEGITQRVDAYVARNAARLDAWYSGATEASRNQLQAREKFLREQVMRRIDGRQ